MSCIIYLVKDKTMNTRSHMIINFIGFQLGWFACVLMAARQQPATGAVVALILVALHIYFMNQRGKALTLILIVTLLGSIWDSLLTQQQILVFETGLLGSQLAPYWISAMWLVFATTLNLSLRWLHDHYMLAMLLGAIAGPLAYLSGSALGAVVIPDTGKASLVLAIGWSIMMPLLIKLAKLMDYQPSMRTRT